jgi:outer membrane protein insertion porin family
MYIKKFLLFFLISNVFLFHKNINKNFQNNFNIQDNINLPSIFIRAPIVKEIKIEGLVYVPKEAVLAKLTIKEGEKLDAKKCSLIVRNIYNLGYFSDVVLEYEESDEYDNKITIYIKVKEKQKLADIIFNGNDHLSQETLEKKFNISKIHWIDQQNATVLCEKIKKLYAEKQYHKATIGYRIEPVDNDKTSFNVYFDIKEGVFGRVKTISFKGNKELSRHQIKEAIVSKEYWLLGFLDRGGVFRKEMVDFDRYQIESFYQSKGFFEAKVTDVKLDEDPESGMIDITFYISEGPLYRFGLINVPENKDIPYFQMRRLIGIDSGEIYSREKIKIAINELKMALGETGYMYANVNPKMKVDKEKNLINLDFVIEKGKPIYVRRINIKGNTKTHEEIIRREILFNEGELLTSKKLQLGKRSVETLGYFAPNTGVDWNLQTIDAFQADLDLIVQEAKTGRFYLNIGINSGSDAGRSLQMIEATQREPRWYDTLLTTSKIGLTIQDSNWSGKGLRYYVDGSYSNVDKSLSCGMSTNWLYDLPVSAGWNLSFRDVFYSDFKQSTTPPNEKNRGGNVQFGFRSHKLNMVLFALSTGIDTISYKEPVIPKLAFPENISYQLAYSEIVRRSFQPGAITWATFSISDDKRNHSIRASEGYQWLIDCKVAFPNQSIFMNNSNFGYIRTGFDGRWYTPLIKTFDVIFYLHGYGGIIFRMPGCNVPYKELFHVGGPQSVRGFLYGQIGPTLMGSSLGATKSFFVNAEIQCPINKTASMTGILFYDGGAAWDTIFNDTENPQLNGSDCLKDIFNYTPTEMLIRNNSLKYRHSVGVGIRLTSPMPIKIDWGFKIDRNKKAGEPLSEVHISMEGSY